MEDNPMAKLIQKIETSFESETVNPLAEFTSALAFLALVVAGLSWLFV